MSPGSELHAIRNISGSPGSDIVHGESDVGSFSPPPREASAIASLEPAVFPPSRQEDPQNFAPLFTDGNAPGVLASQRGSKPVWGRALNGAIDTGPVVLGGSFSWPALSESAKVSTKPSFDGSASALSSTSPPMQRKFANRGGGGNSGDGVGPGGSFSSNDGSSSSSSTTSSVEMSSNIADKQPNKGNYNNWDHRPRESHGWVDQGDRQRRHGGSSRRGSYVSRRDEDRGGHEWSSYRPLSVRDSYMQRGHPRPPAMRPHMPAMVPFVAPPPLFQHIPGPMAYPDFPPQLYFFPTHPHAEPFRGHPFVPLPAPPPLQQPMFFTSPEHKRTLILKQIEYYFSSENLCKDLFLRSNMDNHGWVPILVIADFKRIKLLTENIPFILDAIRSSDVVEVEGNRVRKRDGWKIWVLNPSQNQYNTESEPKSQTTTNQESLVYQVENIALEEGNGRSSIES